MEYLSVMKYMIPTKLVDHPEIEYIHNIHFPWMNEYNYRQAYLATLGMADIKYQSLYDSYINDILLNILSIQMYTYDVSTYTKMIEWIRKDHRIVYMVLGGDLSMVDILRR